MHDTTELAHLEGRRPALSSQCPHNRRLEEEVISQALSGEAAAFGCGQYSGDGADVCWLQPMSQQLGNGMRQQPLLHRCFSK